ncbi:hypothetical protein bpr_II067 (plasmid) [Butyrivibrio proteoclasticus B316]|uniref:Uncharacterized protein n=1 Tax=Butyrivibrio proteoclasticus (strain ATCC 51982 / DSM 14932 / B316) TaxID=515622 RepID=E0S3M5_BUTPB|nr:hypothetical protein bpr_II067 [Butyrivibrio proteoclasticus B316]
MFRIIACACCISMNVLIAAFVLLCNKSTFSCAFCCAQLFV